jgi:protein-disulfide isomerase
MNKRILWIVGGVVGLALIVALAASVATEQPVDEGVAFGPVTVEGSVLPEYSRDVVDGSIGMVAPTITGEDADGNPVTIGPDGRAKVVAFMAHWCPHCQRDLPVLKGWLDQTGGDPAVDVYAVTTLSDRVRPNFPPQDWLAREGWSEAVILDDENDTAARALGLTGTPFYVVLDGSNTVLSRVSGEIGTAGFEAIWGLAAAAAQG